MPEPSEETAASKSFDAATPAVEAAGAILTLRLDSVEDRLEVAADRGEFEPRAVHQMRVATRRASAALRVFESLLTPRIVRRTRKGLRKIRRSGEATRRCDVHVAMLSETLGSASGPLAEACAFAIGRIASERRCSLRSILRLTERDALRNLRRARKSAVARLDEHGDALTLGELAARVLPASLDGLRAAAAEDLSKLESIHALRLAEKRLRYDLEILECASPSEATLAKPSAMLTNMQNRFGALNDLCELVDRISTWLDAPDMESLTPGRIAEGLRTLLDRESARLVTLHESIISTHGVGSVGALVDQISQAFGFAREPLIVIPAPGSNGRSVADTATSAQR